MTTGAAAAMWAIFDQLYYSLAYALHCSRCTYSITTVTAIYCYNVFNVTAIVAVVLALRSIFTECVLRSKATHAMRLIASLAIRWRKRIPHLRMPSKQRTLRHLTTIDFGRLTYRSELDGIIKAAGMKVLEDVPVPGSIDTKAQTARLLVLSR